MPDALTVPETQAQLRDRTLGLYVHWPFCEKKCPYCDFNSHVRPSVDHTRWRAALLAELRAEAALVADHQPVSLFFGGGTPSLMEPDTVAAIIAEVRALWPDAPALEITLEANPSSVEAGRFRAFANAGVNRVSLGVQALDDATLRFLGRLHGRAEALAALEIAQDTFERVSFDLITARPEQTLAQWRGELAEALAFGTDHLSLYQLTIEPNTGFAGQYARGAFTLPDEELGAALFEQTLEQTAAAGLPAYEVSNHSRPGSEARHNLVYWRSQPYLGIGPGAHGRRAGAGTTRLKRPEAWLKAVETTATGLEAETPIPPRTRAEEALVMGLRLAEGIDSAAFQARTGVALTAILDPRGLITAVEEGLVTWDGQSLAATSTRGWPVLDSLLGLLVAS